MGEIKAESRRHRVGVVIRNAERAAATGSRRSGVVGGLAPLDGWPSEHHAMVTLNKADAKGWRSSKKLPNA
jgi:hypothetical protein